MPDKTFTTYSSEPHFDDFHQSDSNGLSPEQKNYLRILYKPGVSVQTRELNQMQSMLQAQIDRVGHGVFKEGASVIDGTKNFDDNVFAIDVTLDTNVNVDDLTIIKNTDGLRATVLHNYSLGGTSYRLFIRYENSTQEDGENVKEFTANASIYNDADTPDSTNNNIGSIDDIRYAAIGKVESGVFFIRGEFVLADEQTLYLVKPKLDDGAEYIIQGKLAFEVTENIVENSDDSTLNDNADGEPNFVAPGADRYAISLNLKFISDNTSEDDVSFASANSTSVVKADEVGETIYTPLLNIVDGGNQTTTQELVSDTISATLATRTSEESGDYTVDPFIIDVREFWNDESDSENRGLYTTDQIKGLGIVVPENDISEVDDGLIDENTSDADVETYGKSRFSVGLEPSVAYVDGYRVEAPSKVNIEVERARTTEEDVEVYTTARLGNYIKGDLTSGLPQFGESVAIAGSVVTAKVRGLEKYGADDWRLYLYDLSGSLPSSGANTVTGDVTGFAFKYTDQSLSDTEYNRTMFELPHDNISNVASVEFVVREIDIITVESGTVTIQRPSDRFHDENWDSYIVVDSGGNEHPVTGLNIGGVTSAVLSFGSQKPSGDVTVMFSYTKELNRKQKVVNESTKVIAGLGNTFVDLEHLDVFEIVSATNNGNDVLDSITLDDGQRDGVYKTSKIKSSTALSGDTTIVYKYFSHGAGHYYSNNSYDIPYEDIPSYGGAALSDVLDFRPDESNYDVATLDPNSVIEATVSYYLNRVDSVVVSSSGDFSVIKGIPALDPVQPETPDDSMLLYVLDVPAYTFSVHDIQATLNDNRRYTMRDIGELEGRIKNLEYYTSLSLLEREANDKQIIDDTGARFKNGILVDSFSGHSVGDVNDPGYICAIDKDEGILRPAFSEESVRFALNSTGLENNSYGDLATLANLGEVPVIEQMKASMHMSVNPYAVAAWWGEVKLSPSSDEWKETSQRPDVIVNRENDAATLQAIADATKAQGTIWRSWRTNWNGRTTSSTATSTSRRRSILFGRSRGRGNRSRSWRTTTTTRTAFSQSGEQTREGIRTTASIETVRAVVNNKVIDTSFVPFMRSRRVYFKGSMFRPGTKLSIFFDGVDISSYATKAAFIPHKTNAVVKSYLDDNAPFTTDSIARQELITDSSGAIEGYFIVPNNAALKFRTGEREVTFTDSENNEPEQSTTSATAVYSAKGVMQHKQRTVVSSRRVSLTQERVTETRATQRSWSVQSSRSSRNRRRWRDPLAQSFMIGEIESGIFATSIDLFFYQKSKTVPVQAYIVTMDNGYPTQEIVPFSEVTLNHSQVNVSEDSTKATKFEFDSPVYLQQGTEYAIVVLSNDDSYRMWLSEIGLKDKATGEMIVKNPYTGVMFKSQNASTWSADQNKDFKFKLNRAKYATGIPTELTFDTLGVDSNNTIDFSQLSVIAEALNFPQTSLNFELTLNGSSQSPKYYPIELSEDIILSDLIDDEDDIKLKAILSTESEYTTPVVDLDRVSFSTVLNDVNDEETVADTELAADHGTANARYITRTVELNNPAEQLDIFLNIHRPTNTSNVRVYARFKTSEESIENIAFDHIEPSTVIPISSTTYDFNEVQFSVNTASTSFTAFQVKIVMVSDAHKDVPTIKDFRSIATT